MITLSIVTNFKKYNFQNKEFNIIADVWLCGSAEKDNGGNKFSGSYPAGFLKRFKSAFKDYLPNSNTDILHVCAGRLPREEGIRLDISEKYNPDILSNAEDMQQVSDESFPWVIADPPYNEEASQKYYNAPLLSKVKMIREMARVCKQGGYIALLDQYSPNSVSRCLKRIALIGVTSVPNTDMRIFTVWKKVSKFGTTASKKKK